jgi:copper transporter 1
MQMYFFASSEVTILFKGWMTTTWAELFGSCIAVLVMAILYEGLKSLRRWLVEVAIVQSSASAVGVIDSTTSLAVTSADRLPITAVREPRWNCNNWSRRQIEVGYHVLQGFLHLVQVTLGYLLMLVAMTYNVYLFISVVLGATIGYLLFCFKRPIIVDPNEQCH